MQATRHCQQAVRYGDSEVVLILILMLVLGLMTRISRRLTRDETRPRLHSRVLHSLITYAIQWNIRRHPLAPRSNN